MYTYVLFKSIGFLLTLDTIDAQFIQIWNKQIANACVTTLVMILIELDCKRKKTFLIKVSMIVNDGVVQVLEEPKESSAVSKVLAKYSSCIRREGAGGAMLFCVVGQLFFFF